MHVGYFSLKGQDHWVVGSKNVHAVLRDEKDAVLYEEKRYSFALKMAALWFEQLKAMTPDQQSRLKQLLGTGISLCGEAYFSDTQHIVDYGGKNGLAFYALSHLGPSSDGITAVPPLEALQLIASFGLNAVQCKSVRVDNEEERAAIRLHYERVFNCEGAVVYVCDGAGRCVKMYKHKVRMCRVF